MRNKQTIIFDVDGTIADVEHRRHLVNGDNKDWKNFRLATVDDTPVQWVCDIAKRYIAQGDEVAFFSARNESEREITEKQISQWIGDGHKGVFLRPDGDYRCDAEFKSELADKFLEMGGKIDLTYSGARWSGPLAFEEAGVKPSDMKYASIYDSFTITVLMQLEDLGFCEKGEGGKFVSDGNLIAGTGKLPFNTDGGGLCNNHPANRGGLTKVIEAVRQLRGEAHPKVQVANCDLALAHGTGGSLGTRHGSATVIMERE